MHTIKDKFYIIDHPSEESNITQSAIPNTLVFATLEFLHQQAAQNNVGIRLALVGSSVNGKSLTEFKSSFSIGEVNFESGPRGTESNSKSKDCDTIIQFQGRESDINRFITDTLIYDQSHTDYRYRGYGGLLSSALSALHHSLPSETTDFSDGSNNGHMGDGIAGFYNLP